jgi:hypothetical protein
MAGYERGDAEGRRMPPQRLRLPDGLRHHPGEPGCQGQRARVPGDRRLLGHRAPVVAAQVVVGRVAVGRVAVVVITPYPGRSAVTVRLSGRAAVAARQASRVTVPIRERGGRVAVILPHPAHADPVHHPIRVALRVGYPVGERVSLSRIRPLAAAVLRG